MGALRRHDHEDGLSLRWLDGEASVLRVRASVFSVRYAGRVNAEVCTVVRGYVRERVSAQAPLHLFFDAERVTAHDAPSRQRWLTWLRASPGDVASIHLLVRSRLFELGVNIMHPLAHERLFAYASRHAFEQALDRAARRSSVTPAPHRASR